MYELARLGFILLCLFLAIESLQLFFSVAMMPTSSGSSPIARVGEIIILAPFVVLGGALPGVALVALNRRIARWAFPDSDPPDLTRRDVLVGAGVAVAGVYLAALGLAQVIAGAANAGVGFVAGMLVGDDGLYSAVFANSTRLLLVGAFECGAGVTLVYSAQRLSRAFLDTSDDAAG